MSSFEQKTSSSESNLALASVLLFVSNQIFKYDDFIKRIPYCSCSGYIPKLRKDASKRAIRKYKIKSDAHRELRFSVIRNILGEENILGEDIRNLNKVINIDSKDICVRKMLIAYKFIIISLKSWYRGHDDMDDDGYIYPKRYTYSPELFAKELLKNDIEFLKIEEQKNYTERIIRELRESERAEFVEMCNRHETLKKSGVSYADMVKNSA